MKNSKRNTLVLDEYPIQFYSKPNTAYVIYSDMESSIVEQVKQILLQRSVSCPETLPFIGNSPIFHFLQSSSA